MSSQVSLRPVIHIIGSLLFILGLGMLLPALVDSAVGDPDWSGFLGASAVTLAVAGGLFLATDGPVTTITIKQTFLLTSLSWVILALFGSLPFMFSSLQLSFTDAYYESMSGLSTTGGTVIVGLDTAPPGVLLWRALLNWFGGIGIIVMAIAVLPLLRVGGMQLFRTESSDRSDKPFASVQDTAGALAFTYLFLTLISALLFHLSGMIWFDAVCHAMAAVSTGGFSTKDSSLGWFNNSAVLWAAAVSMILGALPLTYYIRIVRNHRDLVKDSQVKVFLAFLVFAVLVMTLWAHYKVGLPWWDALSHSTANVTSIVTDTGFVSTDYGQWGGFAVAAFFFFYFIGGCTGSTSGSIKIFRWQIVVRTISNQMRRMLQPHRILVLRYNNKVIDIDVIESVFGFVIAYILSCALLTTVLSLMDIDFITSISAVASALAGAGPGLGHLVGPAGTFQPLPDAAKWILSLAMLLGRLEIFTVLILFTRAFWSE